MTNVCKLATLHCLTKETQLQLFTCPPYFIIPCHDIPSKQLLQVVASPSSSHGITANSYSNTPKACGITSKQKSPPWQDMALLPNATGSPPSSMESPPKVVPYPKKTMTLLPNAASSLDAMVSPPNATASYTDFVASPPNAMALPDLHLNYLQKETTATAGHDIIPRWLDMNPKWHQPQKLWQVVASEVATRASAVMCHNLSLPF